VGFQPKDSGSMTYLQIFVEHLVQKIRQSTSENEYRSSNSQVVICNFFVPEAIVWWCQN